MYLKRLELFGFKTFATRTDVEFTPGFMGVVGPNGSGKSNLTDAIRYCLGEQSMKVLRASKQEELVFAGNPTRHAAPFCSVTAVFDNSDGSLPLDFAEIAITRKTSREGESQYSINKLPCRQRDVHELLMGSGIGPGSFSVLGRKEVDMVLSSDPGERRMMLEETAGTNRYRFRKKEAMRKLSQTRQNLTRLNDLLAEADRNLEESKKAVERYRRYKNAQDQLGELEYRLAWSELSDLSAKVEESRQASLQAQQLSAQADEREAELTRQLTDLEQTYRQHSEMLNALQADLLTRSNELSAAKASFEGLFQQATQLEITAKAAQQRLDNSVRRLQERELEYKQAVEALPQLEEAYAKAQADLAERRDALQHCPTTSNSGLREAKEQVEQLEKRRHKLESLQVGQKVRAEQEQLRVESIREEIAKLVDAMPQVQDYSQELAEVQESIAATGEREGQLGEEKQKLQAHLQGMRRRREELEKVRRPLRTRVLELESILEERVGLPMAVRSLMSWRAEGVIGVLGELIKVKPGLETAMEAALGGHISDVVTADRQVASRLIERLKRERTGRVTFWPLDLERQDYRGLSLPSVRGIVGRALELIEYEPNLRPILNQILGNTVVMEDMDSAYTLYDRCQGRRPHVVTVQGEYLSPTGSVTGGTMKGDRAGMLSRHGQLRDEKERLGKIESEMKSINEREAEAVGRLGVMERELEKTVQENRTARRRLADLEAEGRRQQQDRAHWQDSINRLESERGTLQQNLGAREYEAKSLEEQWQQLESDTALVQERLNQAQQLEEQRIIEREKIRQSVLQAELAWNDSSRSLEEKRKELERLSGRQTEIKEDSVQAEQELREAVEQRQSIDKQGNELEIRIAQLEAGLTEQNQRLAEYRLRNEKEDKSIVELRASQAAANKEARQRGEHYHRCQTELEALESNLLEVRDRIRSNDEGEEVREAPDLSGFDVEKSRLQARKLKTYLDNFEGVNTGALVDYQRFLERQQELQTNITDLQTASDSLETIIKEMDKASVTRFQATFKEVNATFGAIFKEIFQGGWARLELTNPDDLLDSGVDIVACPPGKKLQNLLAFSTGERTLAASAFLLALLTHKPSPIVVLDELDAPLDDSNVEKIAVRLREFSKSSQFLVITHNRKTMEFADRLYGVTMEEPGVSRLLSVELRNVESGNLFIDEENIRPMTSLEKAHVTSN